MSPNATLAEVDSEDAVATAVSGFAVGIASVPVLVGGLLLFSSLGAESLLKLLVLGSSNVPAVGREARLLMLLGLLIAPIGGERKRPPVETSLKLLDLPGSVAPLCCLG